MKHRFCLLLPLILISACNGSDSNTDNVSKSTFDVVTAELDKTKREKNELADRLQSSTAANVSLTDKQKQIQEALDATLAKQTELIGKLDQANLAEADREELKRQLSTVTKERDQLIQDKAKLAGQLQSVVCQ